MSEILEVTPRVYAGTTDFYGVQARLRNRVIAAIRESFELFGFEPLETPVIEYEDTLRGKYGEEGEMRRFKLVATYLEAAGLRYDHTVPLARFMAMNWNKFPMPYRRYAIGSVFRNESIQAGRFRQFVQCDFDTVGSSSPLVDAEIVAINYTILTKLGFPPVYKIRINSRELLNAMIESMGVIELDDAMIYMRIWDKLEKTSLQNLFEEFCLKQAERIRGKTLPPDSFENPVNQEEADLISRVINERGLRFRQITQDMLTLVGRTPEEVVVGMLTIFGDTVKPALDDLLTLISYVRAMGVPDVSFQLRPDLARGLDYYTGPIFETVVETAGIGSITGGGRFDNLIKALGGPDLPASGSSFGLERLMAVMEQLGIADETAQTTQVFCTVFDPMNVELVRATFSAAQILRLTDVPVEVYTGGTLKLRKQLDIANRKKIRFVTIIGPNELERGIITLRDMDNGSQVELKPSQLAETIKWRLAL